MDKNTDPKYLGPGCWYTLHKMAAKAEKVEEKIAVLYLIKIYSTDFFCLKCQGHFNEFIKLNPPSSIVNNKEGLFHWTWMCHNNANALTGKPQISYENAKSLYFNTKPCEHSCGVDKNFKLMRI
jgi:hypothetical protein